PITALLPGNLGYADLTRLQMTDVDALFDKIQGTRGLILDMRGYPKGTAWAIAPRLNVKHATEVATFYPSIVSGDGSDNMATSKLVFQQPMPPGNGKPLYRGKVVMLIDDRAQSQSEHSGLLFESACDTAFIGTPTAGSNGDITNTVLPGGLTVSFTGQGVEHLDGRQLQRVGLQPKILVSPTLRGLRAGKDEVLDRAVRFLTQGH
ncbi:MAG TPA: S41 family peptidase, partial [Holophagaceae bacterium]